MSVQLAMFYGVGERNRIVAAMNENHGIWLTSVRSFAREYATRHGEVSVDNVRTMVADRDFPMPSEIGMKCGDRIFGAVLSGCKDFVPVRQALSTRSERIARSGRGSSYITIYALTPKSSQAALGNASRSVSPFSGREPTFKTKRRTRQTSAAS